MDRRRRSARIHLWIGGTALRDLRNRVVHLQSVIGTRLPTAEERLLITNPMATGTSTSEIVLAGSAAVIKQGRGRIVLDGPHDRSELSLYLPTAS